MATSVNAETRASATDPELVRAVADGTQDALATLYDRHARVLLSLGQRMLRSRPEAEDLVHDVFIEAWKRAKDYDATRGPVRSWLLMRMRSRALDRMKSSSYAKVSSITTADGADEDFACPPSDALDVSDCVLVRRSLSSLPLDQRTVVELVYLDGLTLADIAERTAVPLGTIKSRLARALHALRAACLGERAPRLETTG